MEIGNILKLLLIAAVCLLSVLANGKKKKPRGTGLPLPQAPQEASHPQAAERKRPLGFAIPHLKGAPPQPPAPDDDGVYREQAPRAAGEQARPSAAPAQPAPRGRVLGDADVSVENQVKGSIGRGFVVLLGVEEGDNETDADYIAEKVSGLRVFDDSEGKMNLSVSPDMVLSETMTIMVLGTIESVHKCFKI